MQRTPPHLHVLVYGPFRVAAFFWRPDPAAVALTLICKTTYRLVPGRAIVADALEPPNEHDNYWDDDPARGLHQPSDLVPFKPRADVLLVGSAFVHDPSRKAVVRLRVGKLDKTLELGPTDGKGRLRLPNHPQSGLGPIPQGLRSRGGNGQVPPGRWPDEPFPPRFDFGWFNVAPQEQQVDPLLGDETILLEHLHPEHARLETALPGLCPFAVLDLPDAGPRDVMLIGDTLWIDTDRSVATLTWRASFALEPLPPRGRIVVVPNEGEPIDWGEIERRTEGLHSGRVTQHLSVEPTFATVDSDDGDVTMTFIDSSIGLATRRDPALPFAPPPTNLGPSPWVPQATDGSPPSSHRAAQLAARAGRARMGDVHPFEPGSAAAFSAAAAATERSRERAPSPTMAARKASSEVIELAWYERDAIPTLRKHPSLRKLILAAPPPHDPAARALDRTVARERRDVLAVLRGAEALGRPEVDAALAKAMEGGVFVPPFIMVAGELQMKFDEVETLKATISVVAPFAGDKKIKEAIDAANSALDTPYGASAIAEPMTTNLRLAFGQSQRVSSPELLETQVSRMLLSGRHYQKRTLLGRSWICSSLVPPGGESLVCYLPASLHDELPMFQRFPVKIIGEARPPIDQFAPPTPALTAIVLARVLRSG